jgi:subtilisin
MSPTEMATIYTSVDRGPALEVRDLLRGFQPESVPEPGTRFVRWAAEFEGREGVGVRIALLDGGACLSDPDFSGAAIHSVDFAGESLDSPDDEQHATRDLMLLIGQGHARMRGLVPRAEILHARVLTGEGGDSEVLAAAIGWARQQGADIVVMPLGMESGDTDIAAAIDRGLAAGICFFAAAGNRHPRPLDFPARHRGVLAVGGADARGTLLASCCRSPRLDWIAPGHELPAPNIRGCGSSVACVLAAGVEALRRASA